jgi:lipid-binding SYLF domain-containing protein
MRKYALALMAGVMPGLLLADSAQERLKESAAIFQEIMATPDKAIPQDLLDRAHCMVLVPGMKSGAFIVGGKYGRGFAMCRKDTNAGWGAPGAVRIEGGTFGFQIGGKETDLVMLVMNETGARRLLDSQFTLGGQASVAGGPVGRTATANTDAYMRAEILSWSRSRGAFAGLALEGATLRNDIDENEELYGKRLENKDILMTGMKAPAAAEPLLSALNKYSRREQGGASADRQK